MNNRMIRVVALCVLAVPALVVPAETLAAGQAPRAFSKVARMSPASAKVLNANVLARSLGLREDKVHLRGMNAGKRKNRRYARPSVPFGRGRSFKATILSPASLARFGIKGIRRGDRVRVVGLPNGRIGIVPLRPRSRPVILKSVKGVFTSCGCFEHGNMLKLLNLRSYGGTRPR